MTAIPNPSTMIVSPQAPAESRPRRDSWQRVSNSSRQSFRSCRSQTERARRSHRQRDTRHMSGNGSLGLKIGEQRKMQMTGLRKCCVTPGSHLRHPQ